MKLTTILATVLVSTSFAFADLKFNLSAEGSPDSVELDVARLVVERENKKIETLNKQNGTTSPLHKDSSDEELIQSYTAILSSIINNEHDSYQSSIKKQVLETLLKNASLEQYEKAKEVLSKTIEKPEKEE